LCVCEKKGKKIIKGEEENKLKKDINFDYTFNTCQEYELGPLSMQYLMFLVVRFYLHISIWHAIKSDVNLCRLAPGG